MPMVCCIPEIDMDGGVKMTMTEAHIDIEKRDFRGGVPSEFNRTAAVEAFK